MEPIERNEVRDMIALHFETFRKELDRRDIVLLVSLERIDKHLEKLNGKILEHELKIANALPHTIANCPQQDKIIELRDNMLTTKSMKKTIYIAIGLMGTLFTISFIIYQFLK